MKQLLTVILLQLLAACNSLESVSTRSQLERIQQSGELHVLTVPGPTTYYHNSNGVDGFEYQLAQSFSKYLGVSLKVTAIDSFSALDQELILKKADLVVGTLRADDKTNLHFGPDYQTVSLQLIHKTNKPAPNNFANLQQPIDILADSAAANFLHNQKSSYPNLVLAEHHTVTDKQLVEMLWNEAINYTVADSNTVKIMQRYYPELRVSKTLLEAALAWGFTKDEDRSLSDAAHLFFNKIQKNGHFDEIENRHFGYISDFDYVEIKQFQRKIKHTLPDYYRYFLNASHESNIDWRLLAAIGYQESHWNPKARSPTGVRGIMMLTQRTMKHLGITESRLDPQASIMGGAIYFAQLKRLLPSSIHEPDRTWFALAAYNIGAGHLEDARKLTEQNGKNPDKWIMVKEHLPLLTKKNWYQKTRYGRARGKEAIQFVEHIRNYFDVMTWVSQREQIVATNIEMATQK